MVVPVKGFQQCSFTENQYEQKKEIFSTYCTVAVIDPKCGNISSALNAPF